MDYTYNPSETEDLDLSNYFIESYDDTPSSSTSQKICSCVCSDSPSVQIVQVLVLLMVAYLAWNINAGEPTIQRLIYTFFAVVFNVLYLIYYFFRYVL